MGLGQQLMLKSALGMQVKSAYIFTIPHILKGTSDIL